MFSFTTHHPVDVKSAQSDGQQQRRKCNCAVVSVEKKWCAFIGLTRFYVNSEDRPSIARELC